LRGRFCVDAHSPDHPASMWAILVAVLPCLLGLQHDRALSVNADGELRAHSLRSESRDKPFSMMETQAKQLPVTQDPNIKDAPEDELGENAPSGSGGTASTSDVDNDLGEGGGSVSRDQSRVDMSNEDQQDKLDNDLGPQEEAVPSGGKNGEPTVEGLETEETITKNEGASVEGLETEPGTTETEASDAEPETDDDDDDGKPADASATEGGAPEDDDSDAPATKEGDEGAAGGLPGDDDDDDDAKELKSGDADNNISEDPGAANANAADEAKSDEANSADPEELDTDDSKGGDIASEDDLPSGDGKDDEVVQKAAEMEAETDGDGGAADGDAEAKMAEMNDGENKEVDEDEVKQQEEKYHQQTDDDAGGAPQVDETGVEQAIEDTGANIDTVNGAEAPGPDSVEDTDEEKPGVLEDEVANSDKGGESIGGSPMGVPHAGGAGQNMDGDPEQPGVPSESEEAGSDNEKEQKETLDGTAAMGADSDSTMQILEDRADSEDDDEDRSANARLTLKENGGSMTNALRSMAHKSVDDMDQDAAEDDMDKASNSLDSIRTTDDDEDAE